MGHASFRRIKKTFALLTNKKIYPCIEFLDGIVCKQVKKQSFPVAKESGRVSERPFPLVYLNVIGAYPRSHSNNRYALIITDDYSHFSWVYALKHKSEVLILSDTGSGMYKNNLGKNLSLYGLIRVKNLSSRFDQWLKCNGVHKG